MTALSGAVVLVVGASGGLGSRLADRLVASGAIVARAGHSADGVIRTDLRETTGPRDLIAEVVAEHGRLDGVVIAAGVVAFGPASELADSAVEELFDVNAIGPIRLIRDAFPFLVVSAQAGRDPFVVTLSGVVAESPTAGLAAYSASKAALASFVTAASREFRRSGVRLVDARPGHTATALSEHPIAGSAPAFGAALDPDAVADRIVRAIVEGERDLPSGSF
ncbi:SDR family NAD(P)-dependent oxidoreductase [Galbitalea soli]|uniref:SDR family NAD(P)-dependent oxidoreductase n=1 Tax=Galbitalea soli TaxID=1268042 RepID=A0A7C9PM07_9MICO|nr:SDR family NAD(P)-dependent oxidoreductase [Galbitalea soli]NEM90633.1 SDR family NAD(P)-dependent oxidoreductase [Galbitalea soli]NYJ31351.1 cyclic-di-GMP-binding biofilm dispersal mediator protein [Galbitalea soli]